MSVIHSRPYQWPYHGCIQPGQTALVVFRDGALPEDSPAVSTLAKFAVEVRKSGIRVVHSQTVGEAPVLKPLAGDLIVERPRFGGFTGTDFDLVLRKAGISDLLIAGAPLELGADCTMREANDLGYECLLVEDCCTGLSDETYRGAVSSIQMSGGIFGAVATAADVIKALSFRIGEFK